MSAPATTEDRELQRSPAIRQSLPARWRQRFDGTAEVNVREARVIGAAMLGIAAVRPLVPFEFVPPCPLRAITGIPCPMCGMTRGVTALVHGDFAHALSLNPGSFLVVALAVGLLVQWRLRRFVIPVWLIVTALGLLWTWQLFKYATGRPL
jgi:hypothetical protein